MNSSVLNKEVQHFILENIHKPIHEIVLKGSPFKKVSIQELATQISSKKKSKNKLNSWFETAGIYYPKPLSIEQSSSEITAAYKAELVDGKNMIDLTGGFGVDSYYFSKNFEHVHYCEINEELASIVTLNNKVFNCQNITTHVGDGITFLKNQNNVFDLIYLDPSRRNDRKGKVFLLEDCLPNIPEHLDFLLEKSANIIIKSAPLLDITSVLRDLKFVSEVHVVAVQNEVKEVLFVLKKNWDKAIQYTTVNFTKSTTQKFSFNSSELAQIQYSEPLSYLYEPNAAIMKAGAYNHLGNRLKLPKLQKHSHLLTSNLLQEFPGRSFKIEQVIPYNKKKLKKLIPEKKANITTRNFKESVPQLRKKFGIKEGGDLYVFFTTDKDNKQIVILSKKVSS